MFQVPLGEHENSEKTPRPSGTVGHRGDEDTFVSCQQGLSEMSLESFGKPFCSKASEIKSLEHDKLVLYRIAEAVPSASKDHAKTGGGEKKKRPE